jgi:hypothetical protein
VAEEDLPGPSAMLWHVFRDLDMVDWIPSTDFGVVLSRAEVMCDKYMGNEEGFKIEALEAIERNWDSYLKYIVEGHMSILEERGLATDDLLECANRSYSNS